MAVQIKENHVETKTVWYNGFNVPLGMESHHNTAIYFLDMCLQHVEHKFQVDIQL